MAILLARTLRVAVAAVKSVLDKSGDTNGKSLEGNTGTMRTGVGRGLDENCSRIGVVEDEAHIFNPTRL